MLPQLQAPLPFQPMEAQGAAGWYNSGVEQLTAQLEMKKCPSPVHLL